MTREEYEALKGAGELPQVQVSPSEGDDDSAWLCTLSGDPELVSLMVEDMQSTGGSYWERGDAGFAYCLASDNGRGFCAITNEIKEDGFRWEEGS
jgi:hypothetical protein